MLLLAFLCVFQFDYLIRLYDEAVDFSVRNIAVEIELYPMPFTHVPIAA